jgi:hypothetical protein
MTEKSELTREYLLDPVMLNEKSCFQCCCCDMLCYADNDSGDVYCLRDGEKVAKVVAMRAHSCAE